LRKSFIFTLIGLITLSLIGLAAIQVYWIKNAIELRDAQFTRNVRISLTEFNHFLEKEEATERMRKHAFGKRLLSQFDSIATKRNLEENKALVQTSSEDSTYIYSDDGAYLFKFSKRTEASMFSEEPKKEMGISANGEISTGEERFFSEAQSALLADLFTGLLLVEQGSEFIGRYSVEKLDSLLRLNLREVGGITAEFQFGIFDAFDHPELITPDASANMYQLIERGYRTRLFPSDIVQSPKYLRIWFPNQETYLIKTIWPLLFSSAVFMLVVIFAFGYTISTILRQKKISEIKNDFINNMTHELKTPISTISLACEALSDPLMSKSEARVGQYVSMIRDENKRLGVLVENVLRSAVLDRKEMELSRDEIDLHKVILAAIRNIELQAQQKGGKIETSLGASKPTLFGDKVHLTNLVYNLLDNAIKYSSQSPDIKVITKSDNSCITLMVQDNGIGIKKEDQSRIFDKLFRVPTGNIHNIKGFGLGLSYVKMIVEKHHGTVSVQSEPGKGSTFIIQLPFDYDI
jgi:two-component system phosphate regulon sensor histidine kinase PhoR